MFLADMAFVISNYDNFDNFFKNLLKDSTLSSFDIANIIFPLGSLFDSKIPLVNFFLD